MPCRLGWRDLCQRSGCAYGQINSPKTVVISRPESRAIWAGVCVLSGAGYSAGIPVPNRRERARPETDQLLYGESQSFNACWTPTLPGAAWFRHEMREATKQSGNTNALEADSSPLQQPPA